MAPIVSGAILYFMTTLVLQVHLKQWDKSQNTPHHASIRDQYEPLQSIQENAQFYLLDNPTILEQKAINYLVNEKVRHEADAGRKLVKAKRANGTVQLDRFILEKDGEKVLLSYETKSGEQTLIGDLTNGWIQARYEWRYPIEDKEHMYWLYEEVILNAACCENLSSDHFIDTPPSVTFKAE